MIDCRLLGVVGKRWALRILLLPLAVTPVAAQTIVFKAVPPDATVQCLSDAPASLLAVTGPIPFGITSNEFTGRSTGDTFLINDSEIGSGKAGKINLGNYQNNGAWLADMTTNGCGCTVSVGNIPTIIGNAQVSQAFNSIGAGAVLIMPVVDQFGISGPANIVGFIVAQLVSTSGSGVNWTAALRLLSGPPSAPNVTALSSCGSITSVVFHETLPNGNTNVITRTWTAFDSCGNSATATQLVTVVDNQPPVIHCPGNILTNTTGANGVVVTFSASATDTCGGVMSLNCAPASGSTFSVGTTLVTCTAVDSAGNQAVCSFNVTVLDATNFSITSITAQGSDVLLTWNMPQGYTGIVQATAGDVFGGYSNSFGDIGGPIFVPGNSFFTTNYLDVGGATNQPARYYRVRLVP
jgi:hypothetical protein